MNAPSIRSLAGAARLSRLALGTVLLFGVVLPGPAQEGEVEPDPLGVEWVVGPATGELGSIATVQVPEGYVFAGPEDTRKLMEAMQNPTNGTEMGFVAPEGGDWFVVFEFDGIGYVRDDEQAALDGDAILESLREAQEAGNKDRERRGWETLEIQGWLQSPHYDLETNNLEWAMRLRSSAGVENVNYNSRLLGRSGVMSATLVGSEESVVQNMSVFKSILGGHEYVAGERYAEFREGDKIAKYGLTALITGGAAALALKTGLFKKFWKLIVAGLAAAAAGLKRLFGRSRPQPESESTPT